MIYIVGLIIIALHFHRELRRLGYAVTGMLFVLFCVTLSFNDDASILEISKLEILLFIALLLLSRSNTSLAQLGVNDCSGNVKTNIGMEWLNSKYSDFVWIGFLPFYFLVVGYVGWFIENIDGHSASSASYSGMTLDRTGSGIITETILSAALLLFTTITLIFRNFYLRLQIFLVKKEHNDTASTAINESKRPDE
ncbi:MAG: hypothetical protein ACI9LY_000974 [Arenicella sp.]|jgi:hypothetical protein